jgi:hypothetical protein
MDLWVQLVGPDSQELLATLELRVRWDCRDQSVQQDRRAQREQPGWVAQQGRRVQLGFLDLGVLRVCQGLKGQRAPQGLRAKPDKSVYREQMVLLDLMDCRE